MNQAQVSLARHLKTAISDSGLDPSSLAARTRIPRPTILHLMGEPVSAVLPERIYLRGHLSVLARELGANVASLESIFDEAFPEAVEEEETPEQSRFRSQSVALSAALGGVALVSVVAAFVSALD